MNRNKVIKQLDRLIKDQKTHNEVECGKLLATPEAVTVLLPFCYPVTFVDAELRTSSGDVDLIICSDELQAGGQTRRLLYIWELKAPQLSLFCSETKGRASPTKEFYSAENQLIHYHAHVAGSEEDRKKFKIISANDVRIGGIVIGRSQNLVSSQKKVSEGKAKSLAGSARDIRERTLYSQTGLRIMTWDMIIERLRLITVSHRKFKEHRKITIPFNVGPAF